MPYSYPIAMPTTPNMRARVRRGRSAVGVSRSPFSGVSRAFDFGGQWWEYAVTLPAMKAPPAREWEAFFLRLNQLEGTFFFGDPAKTTARGVATGTPLVNGAGQSGDSLVTDGWTNSITNILRAGDHIAVASNLYEVLEDVNSNGSGQATLTIWPNLRSAPADNAAITVASPKGIFRLAAPVDVDVGEDLIWDGIEFGVVEDVQ